MAIVASWLLTFGEVESEFSSVGLCWLVLPWEIQFKFRQILFKTLTSTFQNVDKYMSEVKRVSPRLW